MGLLDIFGKGALEQEKQDLESYKNKKVSSLHAASNKTVDQVEVTIVQAPAWLRYWARMIDGAIFGIPVGVVMGLLSPDLPLILTVLLSGFIITFIEAFCIVMWAKTPGKSLFSLHVISKNQHHLSYSKALTRSFNVWVKGLGCGIPIFAIFTMLYSYNILKKNKETSWDRLCNSKVILQSFE